MLPPILPTPSKIGPVSSWSIESYEKWAAELRTRPYVRSYLIHGPSPYEERVVLHSHGNPTEEEEEGGKERGTTPSIVKAPYNYNATANRNPSSLSINSSYEDLFASLVSTGYLLPSSIGGITPESLNFLLLASSSSDPKLLTEEEDDERKRLYIKKLVKDGCEYQGFDVDSDFASFELQVMDLPSITKAPWKDNYDEYKSYVEFAIKSVKSNVQFVRIVKANWQVDNPINYYYITFEAYDPADDALITKTYQTRLVRKVPFENSVVDIFRLKPPPPPAPHCQDQDELPSSYEPMECDM